MNIFIFTGNLGRDAEQRFTPKGDSVVSFSVPAKAGYGDKAVVTWIQCSLFGKRGDGVLPYLKKGQSVAVSGELANRPWKDKDGAERFSIEVMVNTVDLLGGAKDKPKQEAEFPPDAGDLDIPFN